ncbi:hypothetical protein RSOL_174820, partial [Rhizoctonia solani AG-3 Rhs1AP]
MRMDDKDAYDTDGKANPAGSASPLTLSPPTVRKFTVSSSSLNRAAAMTPVERFPRLGAWVIELRDGQYLLLVHSSLGN